MIKKLTPEQEALMPSIRDKWINLAHSGQYDPEKIERGFEFIYGLFNEPAPLVVHCDSPMEALTTIAVAQVLEEMPQERRSEMTYAIFWHIANRVTVHLMSEADDFFEKKFGNTEAFRKFQDIKQAINDRISVDNESFSITNDGIVAAIHDDMRTAIWTEIINAVDPYFLENDIFNPSIDMLSELEFIRWHATENVHIATGAMRSEINSLINESSDRVQWDSVRASVSASVRASVRASVSASVSDSVWASVWASVSDSVWASVSASVSDSVWDSVSDSVSASVSDSVWDSVRASVQRFLETNEDAIAQKMRGISRNFYGDFSDFEWTAFYEFFMRIVVEIPCGWEKFKKWVDFLEGNPFESYSFKGVTFVVKPPVTIIKNEEGRLHNPSGPAVVFRDGYSLYFINGRNLPAWIWEKRDTITRDMFLKEQNAEIRGGMYAVLGQKRVFDLIRAEEVCRKYANGETYILYRTKEPIGEKHWQWVGVTCPSTHTNYLLGVPDSVTCPIEAVAGTWGLSAFEYIIDQHT